METQIEITKERKVEIGNIIFRKVIQTSELKKLTIQEVIFSIRIYEYYNEKSSINNYESNYQVLKDSLILKLKNTQPLFLL